MRQGYLTTAFDTRADHTHECRRCGWEIPCNEPDYPTLHAWEGDNVGCVNPDCPED